MSRFPPPPPREDPSSMAQLVFNDKKSQQTDTNQGTDEGDDQSGTDDDDDDDDADDEQEDEDHEQDYLTEQYLRDKQSLFNREMIEVVDEIDTSTVQAKNVISLVLRNDIPYIQRRIITLLAKAVAEQSIEIKVERTHNEENTSMLDKNKLILESNNAPDFSCQVNVISKADFIKRQNDKRSGYLLSALKDPRDNFNAELYFNCLDKMHQLRPGKPIIKTHSVAELRKQRKAQEEIDAKKYVYQEDLSKVKAEASESQNSSQNDEKNQSGSSSKNPLDEFLPDDTPTSESIKPESTLQDPQQQPRELTEYERIQQHAAAENSTPRKFRQDTFLLPGGLGLLPSDIQFDDINQLIKHGTSELAMNEWADASVSGCPVGHIFLHSTVSQSTHQLMTNALSPLPTLIIYVADAQSLGRGRSANSWVSPPGCLMYNFSMKVINSSFLPFLQYFSSWLHVKSIYHALEHTCFCSHCKLLSHNRVNTISDKKIKNKALKLAQKRVNNYNIRLSEAIELKKKENNTIIDINTVRVPCEPCMAKVKVNIKWPNDLYISGKKISGTLLSSVADLQQSGAVNFTAHMGTGLNVSNGFANGKNDFSTQHSDYLTINDALIASYQEQIRFNRDLLWGSNDDDDNGAQSKTIKKNNITSTNNNQDNEADDEDTGRPLPELLDQDDMNLIMLQESAAQNQLQRKLEIVELQKKNEKWLKLEKKRKAKEIRDLEASIAARKRHEEGGEGTDSDNNDTNINPDDEEDKDGDNLDEDDDDDEDNQDEDDEDNQDEDDQQHDNDDDDEALFLRPEELFLLTKEVLLASITLNLSLALPHFNQFGFLPFEKEYYKWWLHQDQIVQVDTANAIGQFRIAGIDPDNGYLTAKNTVTEEIVELHPETHSFDVHTLTVRPKKGMTPAPTPIAAENNAQQ